METFSIAFYCKYSEISIYHARFCSEDLSYSIFVGLKIGVDAPGVLAALRGYASVSTNVQVQQVSRTSFFWQQGEKEYFLKRPIAKFQWPTHRPTYTAGCSVWQCKFASLRLKVWAQPKNIFALPAQWLIRPPQGDLSPQGPQKAKTSPNHYIYAGSTSLFPSSALIRRKTIVDSFARANTNSGSTNR